MLLFVSCLQLPGPAVESRACLACWRFEGHLSARLGNKLFFLLFLYLCWSSRGRLWYYVQKKNILSSYLIYCIYVEGFKNICKPKGNFAECILLCFSEKGGGRADKYLIMRNRYMELQYTKLLLFSHFKIT